VTQKLCQSRRHSRRALGGLGASRGSVQTLNQIGAESMDKAGLFPIRPLTFVAGDDESRKPMVLRLIARLGFEAVDAGPLRIARLLEPYGMLWIDQALYRGRDQSFAFAVTERPPR
jgi:predicted dinucleotide-binding enzyme